MIMVECDNSAFADWPHIELADILRHLAARIESKGELKPGDDFVLKDSNGNRVGQMDVTK